MNYKKGKENTPTAVGKCPRFFDLCSGAATWRRANKQNRFRIIKFLPEVLLFKQQVFLEVLVS